MKTLILLRHAEAENPQMGMEDHSRLLTETGMKQAEQVGRYLMQENLLPDYILCSPATRTRQTLSHINLSTEPVFENALYHAHMEQLEEHISLIPSQNQKLLMVGHNPAIGDLAMTLAQGDITAYHPATVSVFTLETDAWENWHRRQAKLHSVFVP